MNSTAQNIYNEICNNTKHIFDAKNLIYKYKKKNKELTKKLFNACEHKWIYDECANFDDKCKYVCKFCGLYKNPHWN